MANGIPNVWTQMNYVPPRGPCNHKLSVLSPKCPCLRFMLHPLKSSSSYECDGCAHHASFHSMENKYEDEVRKRWAQEAKDTAEREEEVQQRPKKRVRAIEYSYSNNALHENELEEPATGNSRGAAKGRGAAAKKRVASTRAKTRITGIVEDEDGRFIELD
ncbi:uncharacterized protein K460DRAFT_405317 [Cucurbitaria berberidis CBS 394.84]|uniref:Uncharacterized protein n=1 Tax=Cucurbitaria berberidis CBS 394.84 TaxID=1168544 RepID=A0A9P4GFD7_9PLEO|nr:uncharacterized protein K460DRAFT_405317 [Cucurbitaria berberidis CBS 394.84]KAF1845038.1 hypothetical protein K460DRAFT_405317 [Cucurbitaria berberidis CBS 394.84]